MLPSSTVPMLLNGIGIIAVAGCTLPSFFSLHRRFRPRKASYQPLDAIYSDVDGTATSESQKKFSTLVPRIIALAAVILGSLAALAVTVLVAIHVANVSASENWLRLGMWALLIIQTVALWLEREPTKRYAVGMYEAISCAVMVLVLVTANTNLAEYDNADEVLIALLAVQLGMLVGTAGACLSIRRRPLVYDENGRVVDSQDTVSLGGMLSFSWAIQIIKFMEREKKLDYGDLPQLPNKTRAGTLSKRFKNARIYRRLWKTVVVEFRAAFFLQFLLISASSIIQFLPQLSLLKLLQILEKKEGRTSADAWLWLALLGVALYLVSLLQGWLYFVAWSNLGIPIRNMLGTLIFEKAMRRKDARGAKVSKRKEIEGENIVSNVDAGTHAADPATDPNENNGGIVEGGIEEGYLEQKTRQGTINLIGVDSVRVSMFAAFCYFYPETVVKLAVSTVFLILVIGWESLLAGLLAFSLTIPLNVWASKHYAKCQDALMKVRDQKLAVVTEALQGIRQIKFSALESNWQAKIGAYRTKELKTLLQSLKYDIAIISCYIMSPVLLNAACLATYTITRGELTPSVAFTTIAILVSIQNALNMLPELTTNGIDAWVSIKRIEEYMNAPEKTNCCEPADRIEFKNAAVAWPADDKSDDPDRFVLRDINVKIPLKELTVISGKTGSGKSLLLASLLGEVDKLGGSIYVPQAPALEDRFDSRATKNDWIIDSAVALVAQMPWIENATIKDNVLFGLPYDAGRYQKTLGACALMKDLEMLDDGDLTEIGHNGVNLSGGQRWRLSFARAMYSRAGILILDDIFSAVDAHVGRQLFEEALTGELATGRTRILVTHHVSLVMSRTKYTIHLAGGTVSHAGFVDDLKRSGSLDSIFKEAKNEDSDSSIGEELNTDGLDLAKVSSKRSQRSAIIDESVGLTAKNKNQPKIFVKDEKREEGSVRPEIYRAYIRRSGGLWIWVPLFLAFVGSAVAEAARKWWIAQWTASYETTSIGTAAVSLHQKMMLQVSMLLDNNTAGVVMDAEKSNTAWYLGIYLVLSLTMIFLAIFKNIMTMLAGLRASRVMFDRLSYAVLRAPLIWLDTVPVGRILNRFTGDFNIIDSYISMHSSQFFYKIMEGVTITLISFLVSPLMIPLAIVLLTAALLIAKRFINVARSVKRLENNGKSPIYELFGSVLTGIGTVRGYGKADEYIERMWGRIDQHGRAFWHLWLLNRWMGFRLSIIGAIFIIAVAAIIVSSRVDASLAGFALSFSLVYSEAIIWILRSYANLELDMTACERVEEYSRLEIESLTGTDPPASWPTQGHLEIRELVCGYAPDIPPVLKGLSFTAEAGQRIGVVGRTGAGKSSLTLALFRFLEAREGTILIDGLDISKVTLHALRSRLAIIPQDPVLFSGTVRSNLDTFDMHDDVELRDALERVQLVQGARAATRTAEANTNIFASLASPISEGGLNLSQGQRQLLCLARAIVSRPKLMVLDEATSAVDKETDELIQHSIRAEFGGSTLLVVAHRLSTVADFDRILVMGDGRALEFGTPRELLAREGGLFREMVASSGERAALEEIIGGR